MSVSAILLFGSMARSDQSEKSDTDLLMVTSEKESRHVSIGNVSMFFYPREKLNFDAESGDLFTCHVVLEAKAVFDPNNYLEELRDHFKLKDHYDLEISRAFDLGWYLAIFGDQLSSSLLAKRALWCVRTVLIARSAEAGDPVFSPNILAERTTSLYAREILKMRHSEWNKSDLRQCLRSFLETELAGEPLEIGSSEDAFKRRFVETENSVALQTLKQDAQSKERYA